jgi:hypothetical protein
MPTITHPRTTTRPRATLLTAIRGQLRDSRDARSARKALKRDLESYTSDADLNDLHAILDRYSDQETAEIRRLLASRRVA